MRQSESTLSPGNPVPQSNGVSHLGGENTPAEGFRCGYVAIVGRPNVGKSTLMNTLLNQKISIVTPKPQTTRHKVIGLLSTTAYQVVFLDTPGIIKPKYLLHEVMMQTANSALNDADVVLLMIDTTRPDMESERNHGEIFTRLKALNTPAYLVLNKVDLVFKPNILPLIDFYSQQFPFKEIFPISALKNDGTDALLKSIVQALPEHPPFYPLDTISEHNERFFVGEIVREKIFLSCEEEVPYSTAVDVITFRDGDGGKTFIAADIYVGRDSQRAIVVGKKGAMLKRIGLAARKDIETFLQQPVYLELHVKVREEWRQKKRWLERLGYKT